MTTPKIIKAVAFDFGGVIRINEGGHVLRMIAEALGVPYEELRQTYFKFNHLANVNNLNWEEMVLTVVGEFDSSDKMRKKVKDIIRTHEAKHVINRELLEYFPRLHKAGYKVAILSNAGTYLRQRLDDLGITQLVDAVVVSAEVGHQKPNKEAFLPLFEKLGLQPGEVVFVDDTERSLEKAEEIGYIPLLFTSNQKLVEDLHNLGVSF